ncbi:MAG TPA: hypothetical protein C5S37_14910, partial [Methanophagales archaeon]|nr:hypothetical protein [Methanophagales archaeon]
IWEEFKNHVKEKYGKLHTVLGLEVEEALKAYLAVGTEKVNTHTHPKEKEEEEEEETGTGLKDEKQKRLGNGDIMVGKTREERLENIGRYLAYGSGQITEKGLQRLITTQHVGDKRVIEDYIRTLKLRGWIVESGKRGFIMPVMRSAISAALGITLPKETLEKLQAAAGLGGHKDFKRQVDLEMVESGYEPISNRKGRTL